MIRNKQVFEGQKLYDSIPVAYRSGKPRCQAPGMTRDQKPTELTLDDSTLSKHVLLLGGIGTGKTNAMLHLVRDIKLSMRDEDVMIIFDSKGDFLERFYAPGDVVISNDNQAKGIYGEPNYWNLFEEIDYNNPDSLDENIVEIAKTLFFEKTVGSNQKFFPNTAKDLFSAVLLDFCRFQDREMNNQTLRDTLNQATPAKLKEILERHPDLLSMASYIADDSSNQTQGVISELQQLNHELFIGNFHKKGLLSMRQLVRAKGGRTIFIEYNLGIGNMLTPIYRLLFDMAIKEALCREKSEGNVWMIADEFRLLPHLQHAENAVNFGRSLGIKFLIGLQNVEQLYDHSSYGEHLAKSLLSGFSTSIFFRVNDATSREYMKSRFGGNRKVEIFTSNVSGREAQERIREASVIEDWDISSLGIGEAIIGLPGQEPFAFYFKEYR